jgi:hypothetical protein
LIGETGLFYFNESAYPAKVEVQKRKKNLNEEKTELFTVLMDSKKSMDTVSKKIGAVEDKVLTLRVNGKSMMHIDINTKTEYIVFMKYTVTT